MSMSNKSKISVIMSVKDSQESVSNAIESILMQSYPNFEFLIMDDFSNDNTLKIIEKFKLEDNRIKIFKNKRNLGLTKSLNILIKNSKGEFIARQDGDDISFRDRLESQMNYLVSNNLDGCTTQAISTQNSKILHNKSKFLPKKYLIKFKNPFIHGSLVIRKQTMERINYYDEDFYYAQDYKLFTDLIKSGFKINILNKALYQLNTENNISSLNKIQQKYYADCVRNNIKPNQDY